MMPTAWAFLDPRGMGITLSLSAALLALALVISHRALGRRLPGMQPGGGACRPADQVTGFDHQQVLFAGDQVHRLQFRRLRDAARELRGGAHQRIASTRRNSAASVSRSPPPATVPEGSAGADVRWRLEFE